MTQSDFGQIVPTTKSGSALAADLNNWRDAIHSGHRGATRPSYVQGGMMWVQEVSSTTWRLYLYDGAQDILIGTANPVLDTFTINIGAGSVPASAIAGGAGSGLDADLVDGLQASAFLRANASSDVGFGYSVRFVHPAAANTNDGRVGTRLFAKGLNIVGSASEAGDAARYVTVLGDTEIQGAMSVTGGLAMQSEIAGYARIKAYDGAAQALVGAKGAYPAIVSYNTLGNSGAGYGWAAHAASDNAWQLVAGVTENGAAGAGVKFKVNSSGQIWAGAYGNLHDAFLPASKTALAAWVNFNGQGVIAIRASGNVSGLIDHGSTSNNYDGIGHYSVLFNNLMPHVNYVAVGNAASFAYNPGLVYPNTRILMEIIPIQYETTFFRFATADQEHAYFTDAAPYWMNNQLYDATHIHIVFVV